MGNAASSDGVVPTRERPAKDCLARASKLGVSGLRLETRQARNLKVELQGPFGSHVSPILFWFVGHGQIAKVLC